MSDFVFYVALSNVLLLLVGFVWPALLSVVLLVNNVLVVVLAASYEEIEKLKEEKSASAQKYVRPETPKWMLKQCVKCGEEIPIGSEKCPHCKAKQPDYVKP